MATEATGLDAVVEEITKIKAFVEEKHEAGLAPLRDEVARMVEGVETAQKQVDELRRGRVDRTSSDGKIIVREGPLAGFDALDIGIMRRLGQDMLSGRLQDPAAVREHPMFKMVDDAQQQLVDGFSIDSLLAWEERAISMRGMASGLQRYDGPVQKFAGEAAQWRNEMRNEFVRRAMDSTTAGSGDELVPTIEAAQLWMDVNLRTAIMPLIPQIAMPSQPFDIPKQLGDTNWYPGVENVQALLTDLSTGKVTLTAQTLRTGIPFSDELTEDSIIALVPEIRSTLVRNAAEVMDDVILNADQTTTNGINSDGATISTSTAGKAQWLLGWDGINHLPLVDNTSQGNDHNADVTADAYGEVLRQMGKYAAPTERGDVTFITDVGTAIASLGIDEVETVDKIGGRATISTGELSGIYGLPIVWSGLMRAADTDGKVTDAGNSENNGRIVGVNTTQWRVGLRRGFTLEPDRTAGQGQTTLYASFRLAFTERSGTRSTATHTAMNYNITNVS